MSRLEQGVQAAQNHQHEGHQQQAAEDFSHGVVREEKHVDGEVEHRHRQ